MDRNAPLAPAAQSDLEQFSVATLAHYNQSAEAFREGTQNHDVRQNIDALLRHLVGPPPFTILDLGCGPGRDLKVFASLGHRSIGLDGAERFVQMARADSGCEVWHQDFLKLDLPAEMFCGVFANASLFHVPRVKLPDVLRQLYATLKPAGALFCSNPRGNNSEGWNGDRYGAYHDLEGWRDFLESAGFVELEHYYRPSGLPRAQQPWLASVWRKPATRADHDAKTIAGQTVDHDNALPSQQTETRHAPPDCPPPFDRT